MRKVLAMALLGTTLLTGCGAQAGSNDDGVLVVTTSAIVEDIVTKIAGDGIEVVSVIPNGFDSHTYEPRPSEIELLGRADLIVIADGTLNGGLTQLAELSGEKNRILDLNNAGLTEQDLIFRDDSNSWNPHTWTDPTLVAKWLPSIAQRLGELDQSRSDGFTNRAGQLSNQLAELDQRIQDALLAVSATDRKLVVYHDAWEYFGRRYDLDVVGALQAVNFAEPSAAEITKMAEQIRNEKVPAFFGSEVFPSDVLEALERESGAQYVPDLADDRLLGEKGQPEYGYIPLMGSNLNLLLEGLKR
jgi:ABC-type Zn uptake system ZnuABC Zn-binding protein ZnuA